MALTAKAKLHVDRTELLTEVWEILNEYEADAAENIIALGTALVKIGEALKGVPAEEARRVLRSAAALHGIEL